MIKHSLPQTVRSWLYEAFSTWQQQGLLRPDQAAGILALYENEESLCARRGSLVSFALYGLGACMFGLAALLLIGFNWEAISREAKLVTILAVIAGTHAAAFWPDENVKNWARGVRIGIENCYATLYRVKNHLGKNLAV